MHQPPSFCGLALLATLVFAGCATVGRSSPGPPTDHSDLRNVLANSFTQRAIHIPDSVYFDLCAVRKVTALHLSGADVPTWVEPRLLNREADQCEPRPQFVPRLWQLKGVSIRGDTAWVKGEVWYGGSHYEEMRLMRSSARIGAWILISVLMSDFVVT